MRWRASEVADFLEKLREAGEYASVAEMARDFGMSESTPRKWPEAQRRTAPPTFGEFLRRYAEKHGYDVTALRDEWAFSRAGEQRPGSGRPNEADALGRAVETLRVNGRLDLVEHLERQAHFLSMIPALAAEVAKLSEDMRRLREQYERREVHEVLTKQQRPARKATGPPRTKKARGQ